MKNLYEKLQIVQEKLSVPKNQRNTFGNYNYRSLEDITEAVKPLLAELGVYIVINDEIVLIGDRYYVKATVKFADADTFIFSTAYAREPLNKKGMDESQITGAASSYARKYAMNGLLAIDDTKDADATNKHGANGNGDTKTPKAQKQTPAPKVKSSEIVDQAFFEFETENTDKLLEHFVYSREAFEKAVIKYFKKLPTNKASIKKILATVKPQDVMVDAPSEAA